MVAEQGIPAPVVIGAACGARRQPAVVHQDQAGAASCPRAEGQLDAGGRGRITTGMPAVSQPMGWLEGGDRAPQMPGAGPRGLEDAAADVAFERAGERIRRADRMARERPPAAELLSPDAKRRGRRHRKIERFAERGELVTLRHAGPPAGLGTGGLSPPAALDQPRVRARAQPGRSGSGAATRAAEGGASRCGSRGASASRRSSASRPRRRADRTSAVNSLTLLLPWAAARR